jgi:hypothetical protein
VLFEWLRKLLRFKGVLRAAGGQHRAPDSGFRAR